MTVSHRIMTIVPIRPSRQMLLTTLERGVNETSYNRIDSQ
jgi:hypothetical protein